ncbi:MAG TPA: hypothetical protein VGK73_37125 [Polyangiaceae bacterium]
MQEPSPSDVPPQGNDLALDEIVLRKIRVQAIDVVIIKGICEASEGLCAMFAEHGGDLVLAAPRSRERDLDELVADFVVDFGAVVET